MSKVQSMNKVSVAVKLLGTPVTGISSEPATLSFIYGLGRDGLSDFECCLEERECGDHIEFIVKGSEVAESFGTLFPSVQGLIAGMIRPEVFKFDIEILVIEEVENSEVVAALASSVSGCGSGGSCGCGC